VLRRIPGTQADLQSFMLRLPHDVFAREIGASCLRNMDELRRDAYE